VRSAPPDIDPDQHLSQPTLILFTETASLVPFARISESTEYDGAAAPGYSESESFYDTECYANRHRIDYSHADCNGDAGRVGPYRHT
jgi:hypothetical protein